MYFIMHCGSCANNEGFSNTNPPNDGFSQPLQTPQGPVVWQARQNEGSTVFGFWTEFKAIKVMG